MIINDVSSECSRQYKLWGEQNHRPAVWLAILAEEFGEVSKEVNTIIFPVSKAEKLQACVKLREELVQVASVAVSFVESLDRNELKKISGKRVPLRKLSK